MEKTQIVSKSILDQILDTIVKILVTLDGAAFTLAYKGNNDDGKTAPTPSQKLDKTSKIKYIG